MHSNVNTIVKKLFRFVIKSVYLGSSGGYWSIERVIVLHRMQSVMQFANHN